MATFVGTKIVALGGTKKPSLLMADLNTFLNDDRLVNYRIYKMLSWSAGGTVAAVEVVVGFM